MTLNVDRGAVPALVKRAREGKSSWHGQLVFDAIVAPVSVSVGFGALVKE
jgi:hypothetical protein